MYLHIKIQNNIILYAFAYINREHYMLLDIISICWYLHHPHLGIILSNLINSNAPFARNDNG